MTDEIPIADVLLDAANYLGKLGSNLKTRTESLKSKRIKKDKLKNTLAVQKAVDKILLICELSKKSIENVEKGVKEVRTACGIHDEMKSNSSTSSMKRDAKKDYKFFTYGPHKLKVISSVDVNYFLLAKVKAKNMSLAGMEKYPVHNDCRLYQMRQNCNELKEKTEFNGNSRNNLHNSDHSAKESNIKKYSSGDCNDDDNVLNTVSNDESVILQNKCTEVNKSTANDTSTEVHSDNDNQQLYGIKNVDNSIKTNSSLEVDNISEKKNECPSKSNDDGNKSACEEEKEKQNNTSCNNSPQRNKNSSKPENVETTNLSLNKVDKHCKIKDKEREKKQKVKEKKFRRLKVKSDSSDSEDGNIVAEVEKKIVNAEKDNKTFEDQHKDDKVIENDAQYEKTLLNVEEKHDNKDKEVNSEEHVADFKSKDKPVVEIPENDSPKSRPSSCVSSTKSDSDSRPLLKCIDITKLLKPDIAEKTEQSKSKVNINSSKMVKEKKDKLSSYDDDDYWKEKRKEIENFKSKKFMIKVSRLPSFSKEFLNSNNIIKITHNNEILASIEQVFEKQKISPEKEINNKTTNPCESEHIKNALLNDSDSDNHDKISETNENASKNNDFNKEKTPEQSNNEPLGENNDKVKQALLSDSPSSEPKTPKQQKVIDITTPPSSKRKSLMESMHAKKMLLTYSSSSETEDEELRNALREIKESLLEGSGDEQNKVLKEVRRKRLYASSNSDNSELDISKSEMKQKKKKNKKNSSEDGSNSRLSEKNIEDSNCSSKDCNSLKPESRDTKSTETQDSDKDINGLTNLKSLLRTRRQRSTSESSSLSDMSKAETRSSRRKAVVTAPAISEEQLLDPDTSGEESNVEGDEEELPQVSTGINGDAIEHLAKDDLLEESDSSESNNKSSEESKTKKGTESDEDFEDNVKSKRRKGPAISSDSESGNMKKKKGVKFSDFEESETENSEPSKKNKRKKKVNSDSDNSNASDSSRKKKHRRIKQVDDSDVSGSESENEGRKHGRKNIRKVMGKDQLEEATKKAAREEKERVARIAERQKVYNNLLFDESGKPDEVVLDKVILDFDPETKEPLIQVDKGLVKKLKPHQANGIKFMWDACFESVKRIKKDRGSGCILAHCMGLGKTLQVVSLTHTLLTHSDLTGVNRVLVVCPLSTVLNWVNEFNMWLKHTETDYEVDVYELSRFKQNSERAFQLQQWVAGGGVCVLGYEMFRNLSADNQKKFRKKMLKSFQESLVDPGPDLVVCDEGHLLKNEKTSLSQSMNRVKTRRRIVLTGTPLQNNLKEYYCMVQFVKPNLLGKYNEYLNRFVNPITNGQYTDSTEHDIRIMKRRSHVLHKMLDGAVQRRDYGVLAPFLPPKHEYVLFITLSEVQVKLYQYYLDNYSRRPLAGKSSGFLFPDFQSLQRIWTHPLVLKYNSERYEIMQQKKREREEEEDSEGSLVDFIDDDSTAEETSTEESSDMSDASDVSNKKSKKKKSSKKAKGKDGKASGRRGTRANPVEQEAEEHISDVEEIKNENPTEWWIKLVADDELDDLRNSSKLVLLFDILRQCETIGDKLLVFSQSLYSLDLIEHFLGKVDEATQEGRVDEKLGSHVGSWSPGIDYFRLDGSTSCENRSIWCKNFNREDNPRARLFLISTRAGGLGINLVAANRVIIFDVSWNPSHDVQSIFRVYRFGQKKPCYVYRFLAMGTMEEKIYERQVTKQAISKRVIDEQQIDRHYAENDLAELYKFEPTPPEPRPLPPLPKDRLFAEMLREHEKQIYKYHEHDSLLENKEEETLTEEERKAAWEDFENEKNKPPPAPFPTVWPMHNGMAPGLMAQQQQQLAYVALASMLRKDMPNITENQIRDMLPLIYNSNPALMQKMSDIYKYAQQPNMMNPMMNPMGAGAGGTSGLQYEPAWQRQQQQQQQMRLQQIMQHQNNPSGMSGAKFYAGGLGSRDPVAMALQQQRAREMLVGERRRGRPPASNDVVTLDSD